MMIEKRCAFDRNSPLYNVYQAFLIVYDFLSFPYASHHIPASWNKHQKASTFASSDLTECPMRKGELFISKQLDYNDKGITRQACLADCSISNKSAGITAV